jgi:para-aminobenzoate synthetase component 1
LPGFVLLESNDQTRGRYDIVSAIPYDELKLFRHSSTILDAFQELKARLPSVSSSSNDLPFQGGAIGYMAYSLGERLVGISSTPHESNNMPLIDMRFYDWAIVTDHKLKTVSLVAMNSQKDTVKITKDILTRWKKAGVISEPFKLRKVFEPIITKDEYQHAFESIHQDLVHGRAYQVNYTQPFLAHYSGETWDLYKRIRLINPVPYAAFLSSSDGDVLSFSPECYLTIENGLASSYPIKGTIKRSKHSFLDDQLKNELLNSEKNRAENVMIVDLIRNDLGKLAVPGSVKVRSLCELQSFNEVHHLVSHISAQLKNNIIPLELFAACFPGGSITGAPKLESMRIINEQEPFSRGVYCGSIGYLSAHGRLDSSIAIRTLVAKEDTLYLSAGGGIVIDSTWKDEYQECFTKIKAIVNYLQS